MLKAGFKNNVGKLCKWMREITRRWASCHVGMGNIRFGCFRKCWIILRWQGGHNYAIWKNKDWFIDYFCIGAFCFAREAGAGSESNQGFLKLNKTYKFYDITGDKKKDTIQIKGIEDQLLKISCRF